MLTLEDNFKWWKDTNSKATTNPYSSGYSRSEILSHNPYYGDLINLNEYVITVRGQDDSPQNIGNGKWLIDDKEVYYFQRPYIKFLISGDQYEDFVSKLENVIDFVYIWKNNELIKSPTNADNLDTFEIKDLKFYITDDFRIFSEKTIEDEVTSLKNTNVETYIPVLIVSHKMPKIGLRDYFLPRLLKILF